MEALYAHLDSPAKVQGNVGRDLRTYIGTQACACRFKFEDVKPRHAPIRAASQTRHAYNILPQGGNANMTLLTGAQFTHRPRHEKHAILHSPIHDPRHAPALWSLLLDRIVFGSFYRV